MSTLDDPSNGVVIDEVEADLHTKIPKLESVENELESLRSALNTVSTIRDELQEKLDMAVDYANNQAKLIEQLWGKRSEIDEIKNFLGKATERSNLLSVDLQERDEEIKARDEEIKARDEEIKARDEEIKARDEEIKARDGEITSLRAKILDIQELRAQLTQCR